MMNNASISSCGPPFPKELPPPMHKGYIYYVSCNLHCHSLLHNLNIILQAMSIVQLDSLAHQLYSQCRSTSRPHNHNYNYFAFRRTIVVMYTCCT